MASRSEASSEERRQGPPAAAGFARSGRRSRRELARGRRCVRFSSILAAFTLSQLTSGSRDRRGGGGTVAFPPAVRFYFHDPRRVFAGLDDEALASGSFLSAMHQVQFLRTGNLRRGLHDYLLTHGHRPEDVAFILSSERVLPDDGLRDRPEHDPWQHHYTPELKEFVRTRERLIFRQFPEFDQ